MTTREEVARIKDALAAALTTKPRSAGELTLRAFGRRSKGEVNNLKRFLLQLVDEGRASHSRVRIGTNEVHRFALPLPIAQAAE